MSKKNSNVILKDRFKDLGNISKLYLNFKKKLRSFKTSSCLVAVSGGPDSLALAAFSKAYSYEKKFKFHYVLINHNLRNNSTKEALLVKKLLKNRKIKLHIIANKEKIVKNIQSEARQVRYEILKKYCIKKKIRLILTAHNLEDQVETFFIRLSRGSGLTGLSAMKTTTALNSKIKLVRPFLNVRKKNLIFISQIVFGTYIEDPSNKNTKFLRTKIRRLEKHLIQSGINYDQIIKSINNLESSRSILDEFYKDIFLQITTISKGEIFINLSKFKPLKKEIKIKIINQSIKKIKKNYYNPRTKKVLNLINGIHSKRFSKATLGGCLFYIKKDKLCLKKEKN